MPGTGTRRLVRYQIWGQPCQVGNRKVKPGVRLFPRPWRRGKNVWHQGEGRIKNKEQGQYQLSSESSRSLDAGSEIRGKGQVGKRRQILLND